MVRQLLLNIYITRRTNLLYINMNPMHQYVSLLIIMKAFRIVKLSFKRNGILKQYLFYKHKVPYHLSKFYPLTAPIINFRI